MPYGFKKNIPNIQIKGGDVDEPNQALQKKYCKYKSI